MAGAGVGSMWNHSLGLQHEWSLSVLSLGLSDKFLVANRVALLKTKKQNKAKNRKSLTAIMVFKTCSVGTSWTVNQLEFGHPANANVAQQYNPTNA